MKYLVVLFKDKKKRKIINKFKTYQKAQKYYSDKLKLSNDVIFPKMTENGHPCTFELGLIQLGNKKNSDTWVKDNLGRNVKIEIEDGYSIVKISNYNLEEEFQDYQTKKKITTQQFLRKYLSGVGIKLLSKLNNKIVLQNNDNTYLFTFKTSNDSERFLDVLQYKLNRKDLILVKDYNTIQRKYLYNLLVDMGYPITYLQRLSTSHPLKK